MSDTTRPSGAEILDNLQGVMSDAQMGRGDLTYIGAPKSKKRERDLSAYYAVADLIAELAAHRAALTHIQGLYCYDATVGDLAMRCYDAKTIATAALNRNFNTSTQDKIHD